MTEPLLTREEIIHALRMGSSTFNEHLRRGMPRIPKSPRGTKEHPNKRPQNLFIYSECVEWLRENGADPYRDGHRKAEAMREKARKRRM